MQVDVWKFVRSHKVLKKFYEVVVALKCVYTYTYAYIYICN
jgi:hypothetical protein